MKTTDELAKEMGLETYDTALPQEWFDRVLRHINKNPSGHIVWSYDRWDENISNTFGFPVAVTPIGRYILGFMVQLTSTP
jgi:hypothetical protein